jgi:hypothetical protein
MWPPFSPERIIEIMRQYWLSQSKMLLVRGRAPWPCLLLSSQRLALRGERELGHVNAVPADIKVPIIVQGATVNLSTLYLTGAFIGHFGYFAVFEFVTDEWSVISIDIIRGVNLEGQREVRDKVFSWLGGIHPVFRNIIKGIIRLDPTATWVGPNLDVVPRITCIIGKMQVRWNRSVCRTVNACA